MNIFDLIDRWHQRRILKKLIKDREKEIKHMNDLIEQIPNVEKDRTKQIELAKYVLKDEPKLKDEIKIYKSKLRQLL